MIPWVMHLANRGTGKALSIGRTASHLVTGGVLKTNGLWMKKRKELFRSRFRISPRPAEDYEVCSGSSWQCSRTSVQAASDGRAPAGQQEFLVGWLLEASSVRGSEGGEVNGACERTRL